MATGWELRVTRLGHHRRGSRVRTYGAYEVVLDGIAVPGLSGFVAEAPGPGDNGIEGKDRLRIEEGAYGLKPHRSDRYRTTDYEKDLALGPVHPMPAVEISGDAMDERTDVLIHPGHPAELGHSGSETRSDLFLSSIGCLNLTGPLTRDQHMDWVESRAQVVAVLDSLAAWDARRTQNERRFTGARIVIVGEPVAEL